jgi:hypothetical protein
MDKIRLKNGKFNIPKGTRRVRTPWSTIIFSKPNKFGQQQIMTYYRHSKLGQKPYVKEGTVEIDGKLYEVI